MKDPSTFGYQKCQINLFCRKVNLPIKEDFKGRKFHMLDWWIQRAKKMTLLANEYGKQDHM